MKIITDKLDTVWGRMTLLTTIIITIGSLAIAGNQAVKKGNSYEKAIVNLDKVVSHLTDKNRLIIDYLTLHQVDTVFINQWVALPRGPLTDSTGTPYLNLPFLDPHTLPEKGVLKMYMKKDSVITINTLWDFPRKKK